MLVVVNQPHTENNFKIVGSISQKVIEDLCAKFGEYLKIEMEEDDEIIALEESEWWNELRKTVTPGDALQHYRKLNNLTQKQLAEKLGISVQNLSNMEHDRRAISKNMAKKLSTVLEAPVSRFL